MTYPSDQDLLDLAMQRYRHRFEAVYGEAAWKRNAQIGMEATDDHKLFGDLISPEVLNDTNIKAVSSYVSLWASRLVEADLDENAAASSEVIASLIPVMCGLFEHIWLLGYFYRDEKQKDRVHGLERIPDREGEEPRLPWWRRIV